MGYNEIKEQYIENKSELLAILQDNDLWNASVSGIDYKPDVKEFITTSDEYIETLDSYYARNQGKHTAQLIDNRQLETSLAEILKKTKMEIKLIKNITTPLYEHTWQSYPGYIKNAQESVGILLDEVIEDMKQDLEKFFNNASVIVEKKPMGIPSQMRLN